MTGTYLDFWRWSLCRAIFRESSDKAWRKTAFSWKLGGLNCWLVMYAVYCLFTFYYLQLVLESWWLPKCLWEAQISGPLRPTALSRAALLETVGWARAAEQLLVLLSVVPLRWETVEIASCVVEIWLLLWGIFGSSRFLVWNYFWM